MFDSLGFVERKERDQTNALSKHTIFICWCILGGTLLRSKNLLGVLAGDTEEQQTERGYILLLAGEEYWISITSTCLGGWLGSIVSKERIEASGAIRSEPNADSLQFAFVWCQSRSRSQSPFHICLWSSVPGINFRSVTWWTLSTIPLEMHLARL